MKTNMIPFASSVQGYGHKKNDTPNHDSYCYIENAEHEVFVAIVSDGAGSAKNPKIGSSLCCHNMAQALLDATIDLLTGQIDGPYYNTKIKFIIHNHIDILQRLQKLNQQKVKTYNHTLSAVIFAKKQGGGKYIQVGDSPIVILTKPEDANITTFDDFFANHEVIDEEKVGEYANETTFLTNPKWDDFAKIKPLPKNTIGFFAMTDGAGSVFINKKTKKLHVPAVKELFRQFGGKPQIDSTLHDFLDTDDVAGITPDDKTLLGYVPSGLFSAQPTFSSSYATHNISNDIYPLLSQLKDVPVTPLQNDQINIPNISDNKTLDLPPSSDIEVPVKKVAESTNTAEVQAENNISLKKDSYDINNPKKNDENLVTDASKQPDNVNEKNKGSDTDTSLGSKAGTGETTEDEQPIGGSIKKKQNDVTKNKNLFAAIGLVTVTTIGCLGYLAFSGEKKTDVSELAKSDTNSGQASDSSTAVTKELKPKQDASDDDQATAGALASQETDATSNVDNSTDTDVVEAQAGKDNKITEPQKETSYYVIQVMSALASKKRTEEAKNELLKKIGDVYVGDYKNKHNKTRYRILIGIHETKEQATQRLKKLKDQKLITTGEVQEINSAERDELLEPGKAE